MWNARTFTGGQVTAVNVTVPDVAEAFAMHPAAKSFVLD